MTSRLDAALIRAAAERLVDYRFTPWHYGDSIGFEGLLAASDLLSDDRYLTWVHGYLRGVAGRQRVRELDNTAPGHVLCAVAERCGDDELLAYASQLAAWLAERPLVEGVYRSFRRSPLRRPYGGATLADWEERLLRDPGAGVFIDCLHFDPPFFAHLSRLRSEPALADLAATQALGYVALLQGVDGVFSHFFLEHTGSSYGRGWGRGQGWALLGLIDTVALLPAGHPSREVLIGSVVRLFAALEATQRPDGSWPTVILEPDAPPEPSIAAFVAVGAGRAVGLGIAGDAVRALGRSAWHATLRHIDEAGVLANVSVAVWASTCPSHYIDVPTGGPFPWGQGPLLLAAAMSDLW